MVAIKQTDLFNIATSGVAASNRLLQTTSNNIANVNTEGYVRERTSFVTDQGGGVGQGTTERVIDQFAQNQLRRDITAVGEWEIYDSKVNTIDNLLGSEANSLSQGLSEFFASVQTAADDPSSLSSRDVVLSEADQLFTRMETMANFLDSKEEEVNLEFTSAVNRANSLIETIGSLNESIVIAQGNNPQREPGALLNQRDLAINELAELVSIEVRAGANSAGALAINLTTGDSLVLENGSFNFIELSGNADLTSKQVSLTSENVNNTTTINVREEDLGGMIGGLFRYRDEVLGQAQRDIGQLAVAFGDALNQQNSLGMDLDQQLGGDIVDLPEFNGLEFDGTPGNLIVNGRFTPGEGANVTDADIKVTVTAVDATFQPTAIQIEFLEGNGDPKLDASGQPIVLTDTVTTGFNSIAGGIDIDFSTGPFAVDHEFLLQPTKFAARSIDLATRRPEDLAFALPIRVTPDNGNFGDAQVRSTVVTNTIVGAGADRSAFDGAGGIDAAAPASIVFDAPDEFRVLDAGGATITLVSGVTNYDNLLEQARTSGAGPAWPAAFPADYPGYDVSLEGEPAVGDTFAFEYNTNGLDDNRNAILMADLQEEPLVQLSSESTNQPRTFHEAYSSLVGRVGEQSSNADVTLQASQAMLQDSTEWFQTTSGVSLDEEAANLVRFQQSYAASAQILRTAQELFDTILAAAR